jgi:hypothetical protein
LQIGELRDMPLEYVGYIVVELFRIRRRMHGDYGSFPALRSLILFTINVKDEQRKRIRHAAENFAVIRKIALNLLKKDTGKESLRSKRLKAAWDREFLLQLLKN